MKEFRTVFFMLFLIMAGSVSLMAQYWNQIIKSAASGRMTPINARNPLSAVSISGNSVIIGANMESEDAAGATTNQRVK